MQTKLYDVVVLSLSHVHLFVYHALQHARLPCLSLSPRVGSNSCPLSWWFYLTILSSVTSFSSCSQSFPATSSFPISWLFDSGGQNIGASASALVLPMNIQGWFHWLGWSPWSPRDSQETSSALQFKDINSSTCSLFFFFYHPALTSIHYYCKMYSFDYMNHFWQTNVSAFLICFLGFS